MADIRNIFIDRATWQVLKAIAIRMMRTADQRGRVLAGAALEAMAIGLGIASPLALKWLVDGLSTNTLAPSQILGDVLLFALSWGGASLCGAARVVYSTRLIDALSGELVSDALRARLPAAAIARDGDSGRVLGLIERLPYSLLIVADGLIWRAGPLVLQLAATLVVLGDVAPMRYVLALSVLALAYVIVTRIGSQEHQALSGQTNATVADVSQTIGDVLRNARRVVLNGALDVELAGIDASYRRKAGANRQVAWSLVRLTAYQYGSLSLGLIGLLAMGGRDVLAGHLTVGDFVLIQAFALRLILPLSGFAFILSQAAVAISNIRDVLDLISDPDRNGGAGEVSKKAVRISLSNVTYRYGPGLPGLDGISVNIEPGSFTVIVGPNGSGKSTLAQVIAGLLEPLTGAVAIDGQDLQAIPRRYRHQHILYVPQFIGLFNRSLRANALYPPTAQTEDDLAYLLNQWRFYEAGRDIDFGAPVGEQGERLSGGQVQKLELARIAGVTVPAIILDESTSALDPMSEAAVISELRYRFGLRTSLIMISHHVQMAEAADQVLFLMDGRLVATGRHADLCKQWPAYSALWAKD